MEALLRFSGATKRDPEIDSWLMAHPDALGDLARDWFFRIRACGDDVVELMHDGCPVACVTDVPFAYVNIFTSHVNVGFFLGAELDDPKGLLMGTGKRMRHVKLRPEGKPDLAALNALVTAAYSDVRSRLADPSAGR